MGPKVVVGMSGGVDSSVAALLLKKQGYEVIGVTMQIWQDEQADSGCCGLSAVEDARRVAEHLDIPYYVMNFKKEFRQHVMDYFVEEYLRGRTPNPCIACNRYVKWEALLNRSLCLGADHIATGHYARVRETERGFELLRGTDVTKDQSYFLHRLNQSQLSKAVFPVGGMNKTEVRALARELGLPVANKKDSTGICFIGERPFREFLNRYLPTHPGPIKRDDGKVIGEHMGLSFYTLGQRKGIGIGGSREGSGKPWFVARKDLKTNTLWVVQGHDHPWLKTDALRAVHTSWVAGTPPRLEDAVTVKTRYRAPDGSCRIAAAAGDTIDLIFPEPQWAATPGQSAVLYQGDVCLGGGFIDAIETEDKSS